MAKQLIIMLLPLLFLLFILSEVVEGTKKSYGVYDNSNSVKLFVFGDSYADTGNFVGSPSYKQPYGITFPGKPVGRFSDGRVLTDYIASFLKIETPAPYALRNSSTLQNGINFAFGGTGVFQTLKVKDGPNMTVQIDSLEKLIQKNVYTKQDLQSSVALVTAAGNDYEAFIVNNKSIIEIKSFTTTLINQLSINVQRIHNLGINKVAIALLEPLGCLPRINAVTFHLSCVDLLNLVSENHNKLLLQTVLQLNQQVGKPVYVTLDLYNAFLSIIKTLQKKRDENSTLMNPLKACCVGDGLKNNCGSVDDKGEKKYSVCEKPELSFFWDGVHPSQNGWQAVYTLLQSSLGQLNHG
ncbi:GDSL-like lipase/acylhydrolase [Medicago truncatula]|uniref:GDSL-like lipase/acylhydrolase n=1 Tax=Medicago truncatula TaxID=3880 RepID=G7I357_MEDTR|nr:GDSL-like lipase/acylhydrolase [Medicago truncatula]